MLCFCCNAAINANRNNMIAAESDNPLSAIEASNGCINAKIQPKVAAGHELDSRYTNLATRIGINIADNIETQIGATAASTQIAASRDKPMKAGYPGKCGRNSSTEKRSTPREKLSASSLVNSRGKRPIHHHHPEQADTIMIT